MTPATLLNQHSYLVVALALLAGAAGLGWRWRGRAWLLLPAVALGLAAVYLGLRLGGSPYSSAEGVEARLASGRPTLLVFYSDY